ncbi:hypothetical protein PCE1_001674 [Barthelona sp. PCE]
MAGILDLLKPFMFIVPEVEAPEKKTHYREKIVWTIICLLVYLTCSHIPLYGVKLNKSSDPFYHQRILMASSRGSLLELGLSPIMTSSLVMQLLSGAKILKVDHSDPNSRALYKGAQKLVGIIITIVEGIVFVTSGMYGDISILGWFNGFLIVLQLTAAAILVLMLDEIMSKGYGLGDGVSVFIATNICEQIVWKAFSPATTNYEGKGTEFEGAIIAFFHYLFSKSNKLEALKLAFYRSHLPNLSNLIATLLIFLVVVWLQCWRVEYNIKPRHVKGASQPYPIRLFYTGTMPVMLQQALVSNLFFISQMMYGRFGGNIIIRMLGRWESDGQRKFPTGGLAYYFTAPTSLAGAVRNPVHFVIYLALILGTCGFFSHTWLDVSGNNAKEVANNLKREGYVIKGHDNSMEKELNRYIPIAASFGGIIIGLLSISADLLGAIGSGTGILMAVSNIYTAVEQIERERRSA